jgi:hypothetical protein
MILNRDKRYWTQARQRPGPAKPEGVEKADAPRKERPSAQIVRALVMLLSVPVRLADNLAQIGYSLALIAGAYAAVVYICHLAHPAGAPCLIIEGRRLALPCGQQILDFAKKTGII